MWINLVFACAIAWSYRWSTRRVCAAELYPGKDRAVEISFHEQPRHESFVTAARWLERTGRSLAGELWPNVTSLIVASIRRVYFCTAVCIEGATHLWIAEHLWPLILVPRSAIWIYCVKRTYLYTYIHILSKYEWMNEFTLWTTGSLLVHIDRLCNFNRGYTPLRWL